MVRSPAANRVVRETGPAGSSPAPSAKNFLEKVSWGLMRPHNIKMERLSGLRPGLAGRSAAPRCAAYPGTLASSGLHIWQGWQAAMPAGPENR